MDKACFLLKTLAFLLFQISQVTSNVSEATALRVWDGMPVMRSHHWFERFLLNGKYKWRLETTGQAGQLEG
jgi:hypothetical protein